MVHLDLELLISEIVYIVGSKLKHKIYQLIGPNNLQLFLIDHVIKRVKHISRKNNLFR